MKNYLWLRFFLVLTIPLSIIAFMCCSSVKKSNQTPIFNKNNTSNGFEMSNKGQAFRIGFYNVENLFDIEDDPFKIDSEYLPTSHLLWTQERYEHKQQNLAKVIQAMQFPSLLGVTEIENDKVLQDLTNQAVVQKEQYKFAHFESPDERGIDVALMYKTADFTVKNSEIISIKFPRSSDKTRDILKVTGTLKGQPLTVFVNHFPSRRGGKDDSESKRIFVAEQLRKAVDEVQSKDEKMGVIVIGDFNDNPTDVSMSQTLNAQEWTQNATVDARILYNLAAPLTQRNEGTIYYKGWSAFDQIIVSGNLMDKMDKEETIFKDKFMIYRDKNGNELPNRTYTGPIYRGGYSDHFPVFVNIYL